MLVPLGGKFCEKMDPLDVVAGAAVDCPKMEGLCPKIFPDCVVAGAEPKIFDGDEGCCG